MPKPMPMPGIIAAEPTRWRELILVCRKCGKKLGGGFGPDGSQTLARTLKLALREAGRRPTTHVMETKCLGVCPKGAVSVLPGGAPGAILCVPARSDVAEVLARLPQP